GNSEDDGDDGGRNGLGISQAWKTGMATKAAQRYLQRKSQNVNLQDLVYGRSGTGGATKDTIKEDKTSSSSQLFGDDDDGDNDATDDGGDDSSNAEDDEDDDDNDDDDDDYGVGGDRSKFNPDLEALQDWEGTGDGCAIEALRNK
ncbi:unnamed protein product, partial [Sphacelaria rigidula]